MPTKKVVTEDIADEPKPVTAWVLIAPKMYRDIPEFREYFYEGEVVVRDGRVEVPLERPEWAQRLLHLGFEWENGEPEGWTYVR